MTVFRAPDKFFQKIYDESFEKHEEWFADVKFYFYCVQSSSQLVLNMATD